MKTKPAPRFLCPWCGEDVEPIPTDARAVSNVRAGAEKEIGWRLRNPAMCPECFGVGGYEDFGVDEAIAMAERRP